MLCVLCCKSRPVPSSKYATSDIATPSEESEDWFRLGARLMGLPNYDGGRDLVLQTYREMTGHVPSASEDVFATQSYFINKAGIGSELREIKANTINSFKLPTFTYAPASEEELRKRAQAVVKDWVRIFKRNMSDKSDDNNALSESVEPLYSLDLDNMTIDLETVSVTIPLVSSKLDEADTYEDHKPRSTRETVLCHGSRPPLVPLICRKGINGTSLSHGVVGLWCTELANKAYASQWRRTPFDRFPGSYIKLLADTNVLRRNQRIQRGRVVVQHDPRTDGFYVILQAVVFEIPSKEYEKWQLKIRQTITDAIHEIARATQSDTSTKRDVSKNVWGLLNNRFAYAQYALTGYWQGQLRTTREIEQVLSQDLFYVFYALSLENRNKCFHRLQDVDYARIPKAFRTFFEDQYDSQFRLCFKNPNAKVDYSIWRFGPPLDYSIFAQAHIEEVFERLRKFARIGGRHKHQINVNGIYNRPSSSTSTIAVREQESSNEWDQTLKRYLPQEFHDYQRRLKRPYEHDKNVSMFKRSR